MNLKYLSFLDDFRNFIGRTEGLALKDISYIETVFGVKLPIAYREYLSLFGKESGNLLGSYYTEYPGLMENRSDAIYALNFDDRNPPNAKPVLRSNYFFFAQWQGGIFFYFDCEEESENPGVYIFEDTLKLYRYKNSFTEFLRDEGLKPLLDSNRLV